MAQHKWTDAQIAWLRNNRFSMTHEQLQQSLNVKFSLSLTLNQIKGTCWRYGIVGDIGKTQFKKGLIPWNKGKQGVNGKSETVFRKGNKPHNTRPVGSERINKEGSIEVKVGEPKRWRTRQSLLWEEQYGPIPKGHVIVMLDGDKRNFDENNLVCVSRAELAKLNKQHFMKQHNELKPSLVAVVKLEEKIRKLKSA